MQKLLRDLLWIVGLGVVCSLAGGTLTTWFGWHSTENPQATWELWIFSAVLSVAVSIPNLFLMHSRWVAEYPAASPLLATIWRMGSYVLIVFARDATNWPPDNFFLTCLQGCYFPFLLLESALFINQVRK